MCLWISGLNLQYAQLNSCILKWKHTSLPLCKCKTTQSVCPARGEWTSGKQAGKLCNMSIAFNLSTPVALPKWRIKNSLHACLCVGLNTSSHSGGPELMITPTAISWNTGVCWRADGQKSAAQCCVAEQMWTFGRGAIVVAQFPWSTHSWLFT